MKFNLRWIVLVLMCGLGACKTEKKPAAVLGKEEFAELLMDMYTGEARIATLHMAVDSTYKVYHPFEKSVLAKHNVSDSVLKITYQYYTDRPIEFEQVYDIVIDSLSLREQRAGVIK